MLGMFLRSKIAIVLAILGLLVLGTGIGQRTIWLPPATVTAATPAQVAAAPLTVIGPDLLKTRDGQFTMTIKSDGPMQLAVGREDDIIGWIGDASYTKIGAANSDFTQLAATSTKGEATVPNPAGSDMWVSEEKATGELTYTWQSPGRGDWALLLSADGKAAAPTDISITVDNEAGTPWAVPLMIIGSALLALAALMFLISPNKAKGAAAPTVGRRAAGRAPSDPATGALEVDKLVAARESAKASSGSADATLPLRPPPRSRRPARPMRLSQLRRRTQPNSSQQPQHPAMRPLRCLPCYSTPAQQRIRRQQLLSKTRTQRSPLLPKIQLLPKTQNRAPAPTANPTPRRIQMARILTAQIHLATVQVMGPRSRNRNPESHEPGTRVEPLEPRTPLLRTPRLRIRAARKRVSSVQVKARWPWLRSA